MVLWSFFCKTRIPRFTPLPLFYPIQLAETKVEATPDNAQRLLDALLDAGLGTASLTTAGELLAQEITIFKDRVRIDVQTRTPGLKFSEAWERKETMNYQGQSFYVASKSDLIKSKRAAERKVDLEDVRLLELKDED